MRNTLHDPVSFSGSSQAIWDGMKWVWTDHWRINHYDLPCHYCLPLWQRVADRERGRG